jgi:hypothetical protein
MLRIRRHDSTVFSQEALISAIASLVLLPAQLAWSTCTSPARVDAGPIAPFRIQY